MTDDEARGLALTEIIDERQHLMNLAFRMLGTIADAEDVVQETYARWYRMSEDEQAQIQVPAAWLTRVAGRICLDILGSARHRREQYVGEWLPEPVPDSAVPATSVAVDPADRITLDESVNMALMVMLESLTPAERVAFVLHDVFALSFDEIAGIVGRTPQACRKLASSARRDLRERRERENDSNEHDRIVRAFWAACRTGDLNALTALLDPEATTRSDGGGRIRAALNPVRGADRSARFVLGVMSKQSGVEARLQSVNGRTGLVFRRDGIVFAVVSLNVQGGRICDIWLVVNPDKLRHWNRA
jgi:RNA polymerase sigma-70 factor, ECF subfamily